jgi:hypothetical protein
LRRDETEDAPGSERSDDPAAAPPGGKEVATDDELPDDQAAMEPDVGDAG